MAETDIKFGPEWLRALSHGGGGPETNNNNNSRESGSHNRYSQQQMLSCFHPNISIAETLREFHFLTVQECQPPLALTTMEEEERQMRLRNVNSDLAFRAAASKAGGGGAGGGNNSGGPPRGRGSVDRGRGRGRGGGYYQRNYDDNEEFNQRGRGQVPPEQRWERERQTSESRWDERDRRYHAQTRPNYVSREEGGGVPRKEESWRRGKDSLGDSRKEEDGWRTSRGGGSADKWASGGRGSWRHQDRERPPEDSRSPLQNGPSKYNSRKASSWEDDRGEYLPEWSIEETKDVDRTTGTFDASGAFREKKCDDVQGNVSSGEEENSDHDTRTSPNNSYVNTRPEEELPRRPPAHGSPTKPIPILHPNTTSPYHHHRQSPDVNSSPLAPPSPLVKPSPTPAEEVARLKPTEKLIPPQWAAPESMMNPYEHPHSQQLTHILNSISNINNAAGLRGGESQGRAAAAPEEQRPHQTLPLHHDDAYKWFYNDPQGDIQGPFSSEEMKDWYQAGYFDMYLMVRRGCDEKFAQIGELAKVWGDLPFNLDAKRVPPLRLECERPRVFPPQSPVVPPPSPSMLQLPPKPPGPSSAPTDLHLKYYHDMQFYQQQLAYQNAHLQQIHNQLKQQEGFNSLPPSQQGNILMQHLARLSIEGGGPVSMENSLNNLMKAGPVPMGGGAPGSFVWGLPPTANWLPSDLDSKILAAQEEIEKKKQKEEEERQRLEQERKKIEEERLLLEERNRQQEEERRKQELERMRLEELKRQQEEEQRQLEEARRRQQQEEERRQREEEERLEEMRRLEEKRRLERQMLEELARKKQAERQEQERLKREQELLEMEERERRKQQEEQEKVKQKAEEMRKQKAQKKLEKEKKKQAELERQLREQEEKRRQQEEAERQKELEKQKKAAQKQASLAAAMAKAQTSSLQQPAPWANHAVAPPQPPSLLEIQKAQEEKEERERQLRQQQQQLQQQQQVQQQQQQNTKPQLTWAQRSAAAAAVPPPKSLLEIQLEEQERVAALQKHQSKQKQNTLPNPVAQGVWKNSSLHARPPPTWGGEADPPSAFPTLQTKQQQQQQQQQQAERPKSRTNRAEESVLKLFQMHNSSDEFSSWCHETLKNHADSVDIPTFITFLKDVESADEVQTYVREYLGESKYFREFTATFLEKRRAYLQAKKQAALASVAKPAEPAAPPPSSANMEGGTNKNNRKKKNRNRMQKVDSSLLGFTVQPDPDRINVGEIDHVEGF